MLCLNYLNKTVELLFILYNFAIVPSVGTGIKALFCKNNQVCVLIVPFMGTGIKDFTVEINTNKAVIVPFMGTGIKAEI